MDTHATSVVIVDDEEMMVTMLRAWLIGLGQFSVVGVAHRGNDGVELCKRYQPDIVLLDIEMPDVNGLEVAAQLCRDVPDTRIIVMTSHVSPYCIYEVSRLGIHGYVNKSGSLTYLRDALEHVARGECYYAPLYHQVRASALSGPDAYQKILTPKELAVLMLLTQGADDETIAQRLSIAPATVATHRRNLREKLNAHCDRDLIRYANQWGLVPLDEPDKR